MDVSSCTVTVAGIFPLGIILDFFFGCVRVKAGKYSLKWGFYIHLPIPPIFLTRIHFGLDCRHSSLIVVVAVPGRLFGGTPEI